MARGRPVAPLGEWGSVAYATLPSGAIQARTRLRLMSGKMARVSATGKDENAALKELVKRCGQRLNTEDHSVLSTTSKVSSLMDAWIEQHDVTESSINTYTKCLDLHIKPQIGELRIGELSTQRLQQFLDSLTPGTAKTARAALSSACGLAIRWGIMPNNPVSFTKLKKKKKSEVNALTEQQIEEYRTAIKEWCGSNHVGTKRGDGLLEIVDVLIGSGMRIGEVLGLRWQDVNFDDGTISITGQDDGNGGRKEFPKTESSRRTIRVKRIALDALRRRWESPGREYFGEIVFPTRNGTYRTGNNTQTRLREARGDLKIVPHDFRKTVATRIEEEYGLLAASRHLGHASTKVTEQAYLARPKVIPDYTSAF